MAIGFSHGIGGALLWVRRRSWAGRMALALLVAGTARWVWVMLDRTPAFLPWLQWVVVAAATVAVVALLVRPGARRIGAAVLALTLGLTALAAPAALVFAVHGCELFLAQKSVAVGVGTLGEALKGLLAAREFVGRNLPVAVFVGLLEPGTGAAALAARAEPHTTRALHNACRSQSWPTPSAK